MLRKVLILTTIVLVLPALNLQAAQISVSWDGGGDGQSWGDANNWDPNIVPNNEGGNTFVVTIDSNSIGASEVFVVIVQNRLIDQLDCNGVVELDVWTPEPVWLTVLNGITNYGQLEPDDLHILGDFTNTTGATCRLDEIAISADLINNSGATVEIEVIVEVDQNVLNAGTITIIPRSGLWVDSQIQNTGSIQLFDAECTVDEVLDNNSTGLIKGSGVIYADQLLRNKGTIHAYGGSLAIGSKGPFLNSGILINSPASSLHTKPAVDVNNQGTIEVHAGGGIAFDRNLINDTNGVIELLGGTLAAKSITQSSDANFAGFGGISVTDEILIKSGAKIELTGPTNIVGDVNIPSGATLEISDGQTLITGHTTCDGTIHLIGGTVIFQGGCDCNDCNIINEAGLYRNHFDINADGTVNLKDFAGFANTWLWQATWY
jgi:hypothetical protein